MSNKKKPKKLRTPNVPVMAAAGAAVAAAPASSRGAGQDLAGQPRLARAAPAAQVEFDYTYVKKDLNRIGLLAGSFIVALVILSFIIK